MSHQLTQKTAVYKELHNNIIITITLKLKKKLEDYVLILILLLFFNYFNPNFWLSFGFSDTLLGLFSPSNAPKLLLFIR